MALELSLRGGFTLALQRCLSNGAAGTQGLSWGVDVSRKTVCEKEVQLRACSVQALHSFHKYCIKRLFTDGVGPDDWRAAFYSLRGGATNTNMKITSCRSGSNICDGNPEEVLVLEHTA